MIAVGLGGGVGNQLFQYTAGRALALRLGVPLMIDNRVFRGRTWPVFALDAFAIEALPPDDALLPRPAWNDWQKLRNRLLGPGGRFAVFKETEAGFDEAMRSLPDWTYLHGYFQSVLWFADQEGQLRRDLTFLTPMDDANRRVADEIGGTTSVSVHVRRGDYVTDQRANRVHGTLEPDFYRRAAGLIAERCGTTPTFFAFSDDPNWVAENLKLDFPLRLVTNNGRERAADDLRLMAACRHHIVANSSFSWWGAWLNPAADKIVVAPKAWFRDATRDDSARVPAAWIRV